MTESVLKLPAAAMQKSSRSAQGAFLSGLIPSLGWFRMQSAAWAMLTFACLQLWAGAAAAQSGPAWAYPVADAVQPAVNDDELRSVPGSTRTFTGKQIDNLFEPPIWFPEHVTAMPRVVQFGSRPDVRACASCHLTSGQGHPESGHLAGLSGNYIRQQIEAYRSGDRLDPVWMTKMSRAMTDRDLDEAARWFSQIKPIPWVEVIEADTIPKSYFNKSRKRLPLPGGGTELLGDRIAEFPADPSRVVNRDPYAGFVAYAPRGSVIKGQNLVQGGGSGKTVACVACHGEGLRGIGDVPRIAGISPLYVVRQMYAFKDKSRTGAAAALMHPVSANLDAGDITAIAAYLGSLPP